MISDITSLGALSHLESLIFARNTVIDLPEFTEDSALITIDGSHNQIISLDSLAGLQNLNNVFMDYNAEISSVSALASCHCLIQVKVYGTQVTDVTELLNMDVIVEFDPTLTM